ncbi:MAG TPA: OmpA family protein [Burkholderiales bacterium]|nr:OmpA family protein [Burkholderiales bacterium]
MTRATANWIVRASLAGVLTAGPAFAQQRAATEAEARYYIQGAFLTQAAPGIISERVTIGHELRRRLALPPDADKVKIYAALVALTDNKQLVVRKATPEEIANYPGRARIDPSHPLYTLEAGDIRLLIQYDLQANTVPFIGQLGVPSAEPELAQAGPEPKKPAVVSLVSTELFEFNQATLTQEARAKLDSEVIAKLKDIAEIRYANVNGHADRLGSAQYNQRLSEKRAEAVRAYLVSRGADAAKIETFGFGKTLPVKSCPDRGSRAALIECLAPNRRAQVEVQGTLR